MWSTDKHSAAWVSLREGSITQWKKTIYQTNWSSVVQLACVKYEHETKNRSSAVFYSNWPPFVFFSPSFCVVRAAVDHSAVNRWARAHRSAVAIDMRMRAVVAVIVDIGLFAAPEVIDVVLVFACGRGCCCCLGCCSATLGGC